LLRLSSVSKQETKILGAEEALGELSCRRSDAKPSKQTFSFKLVFFGERSVRTEIMSKIC
jgi:hypothetical protein